MDEKREVRLLFGLLLISSQAFASYRVYLLEITVFNQYGVPTSFRYETSTLDATQYEHYHGGYRTFQVKEVDTWYCPGDTSRRKACEKPKNQPNRGLASTEPKRPLPLNRQPVIPR